MNDAVIRSIGQCLKSLREQGGLTQIQVACRLSVTQPFISKVESGERRLTFDEIFEYAGSIGVTPEKLFLRVRTALLENKETSHLVCGEEYKAEDKTDGHGNAFTLPRPSFIHACNEPEPCDLRDKP